MRVALDAMGGDVAPAAPLLEAAESLPPGVGILLVGQIGTSRDAIGVAARKLESNLGQHIGADLAGGTAA